jgi:hypothetical protein
VSHGTCGHSLERSMDGVFVDQVHERSVRTYGKGNTRTIVGAYDTSLKSMELVCVSIKVQSTR